MEAKTTRSRGARSFASSMRRCAGRSSRGAVATASESACSLSTASAGAAPLRDRIGQGRKCQRATWRAAVCQTQRDAPKAMY